MSLRATFTAFSKHSHCLGKMVAPLWQHWTPWMPPDSPLQPWPQVGEQPCASKKFPLFVALCWGTALQKQASAAETTMLKAEKTLIVPKACLRWADNCQIQDRQTDAQTEIAAATYPLAGLTMLCKSENVLLIQESRADLWGFIRSKMNL